MKWIMPSLHLFFLLYCSQQFLTTIFTNLAEGIQDVILTAGTKVFFKSAQHLY